MAGGPIYVIPECDPETLRFRCFVDGFMLDLTLDRIKRYIADGREVRASVTA